MNPISSCDVERTPKRMRDEEERAFLSKRTRVEKKNLKRQLELEEDSEQTVKRIKLRHAVKRAREEIEELTRTIELKTRRTQREKRAAGEPLLAEVTKRPRVDNKPVIFAALRDGSSKINQQLKTKALPQPRQMPLLNASSSIYEVLRRDKKRPLDIHIKPKEPELKKAKVDLMLEQLSNLKL